ncbi:MAG: L-fucose/L-arabinose isomerase family protein [Christensenellales bacterium]|jgi:L-fucose isomerase-like protein
MERKVVKIGFAPTKRVPFNHPQTFEVRDEIRKAIAEWDLDGMIQIVDIDDVTPKNILETEDDVLAVVEKFQKEKVDGIFVPHCNFGCEAAVAGVARKLGVPVLLWGPRDEDPEIAGQQTGVGRTRDTQCGLFATGKALRRSNVTFTYVPNTTISDPTFERGYKAFAAVCAAVRDFKQTQILQIGPRPEPFWTVMINEGEILERFGIRVLPITLIDLMNTANNLRENATDRIAEAVSMITKTEEPRDLTDDHLARLAAYYLAVLDLSAEYRCNAVATSCWAAFHDAMGVAACGINGFLHDAGIPVGCETDIHGMIGTRLLQGASLYNSGVFFADLTIRHPYNDNAELLWHCGNFPPSVAGGDRIIYNQGRSHFEVSHDDITLCRFDGDHGEYSMLMGEGKGVSGPKTGGTYSWFEVDDWVAWEHKIVTGPYIHHSSCTFGKHVPVLAEACRYLGIKPDLADRDEKELKYFWFGR